MAMSQDQAQQFLQELSRRTGASVEQSDVQRLQNTNEDDLGRLQNAYTSQYSRRGASGQTGSGQDSSELTAQGYGSGRNEIPKGAGIATQEIIGGYGNQGGNNRGPTSVMQSWSQSQPQSDPAVTALNDRLVRMDEENKAAKATETARRDALYNTLKERSGRALNVDATDPIIANQVTTFRNEQTRAQRDYLNKLAESEGPNANLRGERRMAAERSGINTAGFQSELVGRELMTRRNEILQDLQMQGAMLSADQQANLQRELTGIDSMIRQQQLALQGKQVDNSFTLGSRGLDLQALQQEIQRRQFEQDLGFRAEDRASYWDSVRRGL